MICCCFIPSTVQKEHSWREFHLRDIPRNHFLPQPQGMFGLPCYSDASMKLTSRRAPTWPHRSHGTRPHMHHCKLLLQAPASSACPLRWESPPCGREEIPPGASSLSDSGREMVSHPTPALFTHSSWLPVPTSLLSMNQS